MEINIKIEGLSQLTESIALLASAIAHVKGLGKTEIVAKEVAQEVALEGQMSVVDQVKEALKIAKKEKVKEVIEEVPAKEEIKEVAPVEEIKEKEVVGITIEEVRAAFMAKNSKGNTPKLKEILKEFNVAKVTDLEEDHFEGVLARLEAI